MVSVLLVAMIVASILVPFVGVSAAVPSGLVGVPDANVSEDFPVGSEPSLRATDLEGSVMASDHAESLEVIATTPGRASGYVNGTTVGGGEVVLVLRDETHSTGRTVGIDAGALREALGYTPERIYGTHDDGTEWSAPVRYEGGLLLFDVAHFSSNVVTFSGTVQIAATPATDGSTFSYDLSESDAVSEYNITVTGHDSAENDTESGSVALGDSSALSISSDRDPLGHDSPTPVLNATGTSETASNGTDTSGSSGSITYYQTDHPVSSMREVRVDVTDRWDDTYGNVGYTLDLYVDGTLIDSRSGNTETWGGPYASAAETFSVSRASWDTMRVEWTFDKSSGGIKDISIESMAPQNATVTTDDGVTAELGDLSVGETKTVSFPVSASSNEFSLSGDGDGGVDWTLAYREVLETSNVTVSVNGNDTSYPGTLADGETATLPTNVSWVADGTNTVTVSVGDSSIPADAPAPSVGLQYSHTSTDEKSVSYESSKLTESYNVTRTYSTDQTDARLVIPFSGNVAYIGNVETQLNGGPWSSVSPGDYSLDGTTLTVGLGSVSGGDTVTVRTTGDRISVVNGSLTVTETTPMGERLDSEIRLDSWANDSYISLGGSPDEDRLHYTYNESFGDAEYDEVTATGYHRLHLPGASDASTFRLSTVPVRVDVATGEARFRVTSPSTTEPKLSIRPGVHTGDGVAYEFLSPSAGDTYLLYSTTTGTQRDSAVAGETVVLADDDSGEILHIRKSSESSNASGGSGFFAGSGGAVTSTAKDYIPAMPVLNPGLVAALVLVIIAGAIAYTERRMSSTRSTPVYERPLVLLALVVAGFVGVLLISPESITAPVQSALDTALPLASVLGVLLVVGGLGYWWYTRRQARIVEAKTPENVFRIGGDDK
ncbi:hypothetical protein NKF06_12750 [Haloferax sp. AB510]|uniref:hypothetical protein n=1 Tax=Haloferax sp. AB510 TaxID=2934172 RepID=UPI00209C364B|nr:hypothetical protein [Haloferax sp. AB510]MCO8267432.1 hypothetical protein [Haloferax sp. AB510]